MFSIEINIYISNLVIINALNYELDYLTAFNEPLNLIQQNLA